MNAIPDYDTKSIPILDDIIENANPNTDTDAVAEQETISTEALKTDTSDFASPDALTQNDDETIKDEHNFDEPALDDPIFDDTTFDEPILDQADEQEQNTSTTNKQPLSLEAVVQDVVKHLMPDLEQQLRFLVQQALEEKLPKKVIRQISTDSDSS